MRMLDRKLLRNLATMRMQVAAIVLVIACGVASYVTVLTAYRALKQSQEAYYGRYRMADLWAPAKRMPRALLHKLEAIEGVRRLEGRIAFDVAIDLPVLLQPCSGRVISVPHRHRQILNDLHVVRGRWFTGQGTREVIVDERFADAHGLDVGDRLRVIMNNKKEALTIVGLALSPEFVYLLGGGQVIPDAKHFTVLWVAEPFAESVFDFDDATNEVVAALDREAVVEDVIARFDDLMTPYGALGAIAREDQLSNRFVTRQLKRLEGAGQMVPITFLAVAAFVLHVLMDRLVRTQRTQIAVLRAFGYTTGEVARHFLKLAVLVGVLGAAVGCALGAWLAGGLLGIYKQFFTFPMLEFGADGTVLAGGVLVSIVFSVLGALGAVRAIARIAPAEGMRAESPPTYRRTLLERLRPLWHILGSAPRMILRHMARTKLRAAITITGVALATSLIMLTLWARSGTDVLVNTQYGLIERQDMQVRFHDDRPRSALYEIQHIPGVRTAEALLTVPVELVNGWRTRRTAIMGLEQGQALRALLDRDLRHVGLPEDGLMMSRKLAELLGLEVGDWVRARVLTGGRQRLRLRLERIVDEYLGVFAYADLGRLSRWIDEEGVLNGALVTVDRRQIETVGRTLKELPAIASVTLRSHAIASFEETVGETQDVTYSVWILFACIMTFGVMYNAARISLAERQRELGSMRVLGFTTREVSVLLLGENMLLAVLGLVPGIALGIWFAWLLAKAGETDLFRWPFVVHPATAFWSVICVLVFGLLANLLVVRRLRSLDLVQVLKERG